jgi:drug/metabolite transporter (DMT)-like permease
MQATLLAIAAGLCWGIGELCTKSVLHGARIGPMTAILVRSLVALPMLGVAWYAALHWAGTEPRPQWRELPAADVAKLVLGSGLLAGGLAMVCFYWALSLDDISRVKPIAFTVAPATAAVLGWFVLGEAMSWRKAIAVLLILAGVFVLTGEGAARPHADPGVRAPAGR